MGWIFVGCLTSNIACIYIKIHVTNSSTYRGCFWLEYKINENQCKKDKISTPRSTGSNINHVLESFWNSDVFKNYTYMYIKQPGYQLLTAAEKVWGID